MKHIWIYTLVFIFCGFSFATILKVHRSDLPSGDSSIPAKAARSIADSTTPIAPEEKRALLTLQVFNSSSQQWEELPIMLTEQLPLTLELAYQQKARGTAFPLITYVGLNPKNPNQGLYQIAYADGSIKETTGPASQSDIREFLKNQVAALEGRDNFLAAVEGTLKAVKFAGDVADVVLMVVGIGEVTFSLKRVAAEALERLAQKQTPALIGVGANGSYVLVAGTGTSSVAATLELTSAEATLLLKGATTLSAGSGLRIAKSESPIWRTFENAKNGRKTSGRGKDKRFYEWDHTHGDIEVYDGRGHHLGSMDPVTGEMTKPPVAGRSIKDVDSPFPRSPVPDGPINEYLRSFFR